MLSICENFRQQYSGFGIAVLPWCRATDELMAERNGLYSDFYDDLSCNDRHPNWTTEVLVEPLILTGGVRLHRSLNIYVDVSHSIHKPKNLPITRLCFWEGVWPPGLALGVSYLAASTLTQFLFALISCILLYPLVVAFGHLRLLSLNSNLYLFVVLPSSI